MIAGVAPSRADVRVSGLFSNGVVLQRNQPVPVWGWADPGESVTVEFAGEAKATVADAQGNWRAILGPLSTSAEPRTLVARGKNRIEISGVIVGEVWLFSGQSNMAYLMSAVMRPSDRDPVSPELARREIASANDALLREFRVDNRPAERPRSNVAAQTGWMKWTTADGPKWAAMAYYFGKRLRTELGVPVGIIVCAWGGSGCSSWISAEMLRGPKLRSIWPEEVAGWRPNITPSRLYNGMLHPLVPFAIAGFGWYHGETEATPYHNPYLYRFLLAGMIEDWRRQWRQPELPFYVVQLPNRENEPRWVIVRESQASVLRLPDTAMIPTIDIGQSWDLHPRNKHEVANRLAELVLARQYDKGRLDCAKFARASREGQAMRVHFRDAGRLATTDGKTPAGFLLAGKDQEFKPAEARIEGGTVLVNAAAVPEPVAVRYAWTPAPTVNLVNSGGIPVPPFRSDGWPVDGQEMLATDLPARATLSQTNSGSELVSGRAIAWRPGAEAVGLGSEAEEFFKAGGAIGNILVRGFPVRAGLPVSPELYWTAQPQIDASRGFTLEARVYVTRIGNPLRGFDLEVGIPRGDGTFRRYVLTVFPMRLHTFQNNPVPRNSYATETRVLRSDLEYEPATYRMAVRADGIAQIYRDAELVGTTSGEIVLSGAGAQSYCRVGKTVGTGEWATSIHHIAFDTLAAFAPGPATYTSSSSN